MTRMPRTIPTAIVLSIGLSLSGCTTTSSIPESTSAFLQSTVVTVADLAAAGDSAGALATLDALQTQLQQATEDGHIPTDRQSEIQNAIDLVRADLQTAPAATPTPAEPVSESPTAPAAPVTVVPDPAVELPNDEVDNGPADDGNGNSGKGNNGRGNNGNGNGKNK